MGGMFIRDPLKEMVDEIVVDWDLYDLKPKEGKFSWSDRHLGLGHITKQLDWFFTYDIFLLDNIHVLSSIIPVMTSNHKSIMLNLQAVINYGPIPF